MKSIKNPDKKTWPDLVKRPTNSYENIEQTVASIFKEIQIKGDVAISKYSNLFDGVNLKSFEVSKEEIAEAITQIPRELKSAISLAKSNIERFHKAQKTEKIEVETTKGVFCWKEKRAIQKIGLYIPGGSAPLFSTVLIR